MTDWMKPARDVAEARRHLDERGYCMLDKLLSDAQVSTLRERVFCQAAYEREIGAEGQDDAQIESYNQYIYALINKGRIFQDLLEFEIIHTLIGHVLGEEYLLSANDAVIVKPGSREMPLHSDQWWLPDASAPPASHIRPGSIKRFDKPSSLDGSVATVPVLPPAVCNVMWAVTDFTAENGATRIVPGSHLASTSPDPAVPHRIPTIPVLGKAGQAMIFDGRLWHATGANKTSEARCGVLTTYCGPQFRQMENYPLITRDEVIARLSPRLKEILGFKVWQGYGKRDRPDVAVISRQDPLIGAFDGDV